MNDTRDPLVILMTTDDPAIASRAVAELQAAGFVDALDIAADFGWRVAA